MTKRILTLALAVAIILPAMAQFRIGPKVGFNANKLSFNQEILDKSNRVGFTGGLTAEFTVPLVGVGADLSVMYVKRNAEFMDKLQDGSQVVDKVASDYIEIPLNFKYKLSLPAVSHIIAPYVFTGPSFAFLTSKKAIGNFYHDHTCDVAWNFGLGLQLIKHLQVGASYGLGLTKALQKVNLGPNEAAGIEGKNKYWTVTAAWLF